jgi:dTDP-4-amino-4,6-dideoxygalactose transaminase
VQQHLLREGIETLVHYPVPIPRQAALASQSPADCPEADRACAEVLSLPMHPGLSVGDIEAVARHLSSIED